MSHTPWIRPSWFRLVGVGALLATFWVTVSLPLAAAGEDPAARRLMQEATRRLQSGDLDGAEGEWTLLVQQFAGDPLAPRALLELANLRRQREDENGAEAALKKLLNDYPRSPEAAGAFLAQGEIEVAKARSVSELENARATFKRIALLFAADKYPVLDARVRGRLRTAEIELQLGHVEAALAQLLPAIEDEPPGPWRGRAKLLYGQTLLRTADWATGLELLQSLADEPFATKDQADRTSTARDREEAKRSIALAHRQVVRPQAGQARWSKTSRYPSSGLILREPTGVAADADGRLLVVDGRAELVALIRETGEVEAQRPLPDALRPAFTKGAAYTVADDAIVLPFDNQRATFLQPRTGKEAPLKGLRAGVRSDFGDWFLLAKSFDGLLNYQTPRLGQELLAPLRLEMVDLDRDVFGRIYLLDGQNNRVSRLSVDRRTVETVAQGAWKKPVAFCLDLLGNLFVLDRGTRKVEVYDSLGKWVGSAGPDLGGGLELKEPQDVAVDGNGRLFIADRKLPFVVVLE